MVNRLNKSYTYDATNSIGNHKLENGHVIHFVHVETHATCHFKAFLTSWTDQFKQDWKDYTTVGRMDPIKVYSRTSREIIFSFTVPSYSLEEAAFNLQQVQTLIQMSYPTFETVNLGSGENVGQSNTTSTGDAATASTSAAVDKITSPQINQSYNSISTMVSPPFFRIKFANWLNDPSKDLGMTAREAMESGLYGVINNVKFEPDLTEAGGFFGANDLYERSETSRQRTEAVLVPKTLKVDINFSVLHTNQLGYDASTKLARTPSYPYNAGAIYSKARTIKVK
jgi:hypothetical protein